MDYLESLLSDLYSPRTSTELIPDINQRLVRVQALFSCEDLAFCLRHGSCRLHMFAFQAVSSDPSRFLPGFKALKDWYVTESGSDNIAVKLCAGAIASLVCTDQELLADAAETMSTLLPLDAPKCFVLLEALFRTVRLLSQSNALNKPRLYGLKSAASQFLVGHMASISEKNFGPACAAVKEYSSLAPSAETFGKLFGHLLSIGSSLEGGYSVLLELLTSSTGSIPLTSLSRFYSFFLFECHPSSEELVGLVSVFQDNLGDLCSLPDRNGLCNAILQHMQKDPSIFDSTLDFWDALAADLYDSSMITDPVRAQYKCLLLMASKCRISAEDRRSLLESVYRILGDEIFDHLVHLMFSVGDENCFEMLIDLGGQYVGPAKPLVGVAEKLYVMNQRAFLRFVSAYFNSLRRDEEFSQRLCEHIVSSASLSERLDSFAVSVLRDYVSFIGPECMPRLIDLLDRPKNADEACCLANLCALACISLSNSMSNELVEKVLACLPDECLVAVFCQVLSLDGLEFEPRKCPRFGSFAAARVKQLLDGEIDPQSPLFAFVSLAISRTAVTDRDFCSHLLQSVLDSMRIELVPLFVGAAKRSTFPECTIAMCKYASCTIYIDDVVQLHYCVCLSDYDSYMEYGIDNASNLVDTCISRLADPLDPQELKTILSYFDALFLRCRSEAQQNWGNYLLEQKIDAVVDSLLEASYRYDRTMQELVAVFLHKLAVDRVAHLRPCISGRSKYSAQISWMLSVRSLKDFSARFQRLFDD